MPKFFNSAFTPSHFGAYNFWKTAHGHDPHKYSFQQHHQAAVTFHQNVSHLYTEPGPSNNSRHLEALRGVAHPETGHQAYYSHLQGMERF